MTSVCSDFSSPVSLDIIGRNIQKKVWFVKKQKNEHLIGQKKYFFEIFFINVLDIYFNNIFCYLLLCVFNQNSSLLAFKKIKNAIFDTLFWHQKLEEFFLWFFNVFWGSLGVYIKKLGCLFPTRPKIKNRSRRRSLFRGSKSPERDIDNLASYPAPRQ